MAAARARNDNPYEDGGGFGKFRKRPFRRSTQATPYDRPPTAIRNSAGSGNGDRSWFSKLVDPAQRLITSSAHKLFASVFRKRLPPPPPPPPPPPVASPALAPPAHPPESEANEDVVDRKLKGIAIEPPGTIAVINGPASPVKSSDRGGITELELILKEKMFTRSEIDRLTALLQSRTVDLPVGYQGKKPDAVPEKAVISQVGKDEFVNTPARVNGTQSYLISTPKVLDEDVASPAELAKAYMGSSSKVSPSMLGSRSQPFREDSASLISYPFHSRTPTMSVVPRSSGRAGFPENGFITPRSTSRSAIYNMARTPYSRVHSTATLQGVNDSSSVPSSSSQSTWEHNRYSGSKQGALKRRISVLENDVGSVGPIRRIRQKSNLLPAPGTLSSRGSVFASHAAQPLPQIEKPVSAIEPSTEVRDKSNQNSSSTTVPSKSSETASKILQQLEVLVSSREKSPSKLSPSMLRGPALRSLENVDSSKFVETVRDSNKLDVKQDRLLADSHDSICQKQDKVEENGPAKLIFASDKSASAANGTEIADLMTNKPSTMAATLPLTNSVAHSPPLKKRAFHMSAGEDFLDMDDDDSYNGTTSAKPAEGSGMLDKDVTENNTHAAEAINLEKPSEAIAPATFTLDHKQNGTSDSPAAAKKSGEFTFLSTPLSSTTAQPVIVDQSTTSTDGAASAKESNALLPVFKFGEKTTFERDSKASRVFLFASEPVLESKSALAPNNFSFEPANKGLPLAPAPTSVLSTSSIVKFDASSDPKPESGSFSSVAAVGNESGMRQPVSDKADNKNIWNAGGFLKSSEIVPLAVPVSSPAASIFPTGAFTTDSSLNNGPSAPLSFSSNPLSSPNNVTVSTSISSGAVVNSSSSDTSVTVAPANSTSNGSQSLTVAQSSSAAASVFKFGSPAPPSTLASSVSATSVESKEAKTSIPGFGNLSSSPFGGTSTGVTSTGNSVFSFNAGATTSGATNQSQGFSLFKPGGEVSTAGTATPVLSQSAPAQLASSGSGSSSFGLTSNVPFTSSSVSNSVPANTSTSASIFNSSWQVPVSSAIGSTFNSSSSSFSAGFPFGGSSSGPATSIASAVFGTGAQSGSIFNFSSPATTATSQSVFGSPNPVFPSSPSGNNDQMSMEDNMAEDAVQATTPSGPSFGQQALGTQPFVFGHTPAVNQFTSTAPSVFQFPSQQNMSGAQNVSPFQSSSVDFNQGSSFSLGPSGDPSGDKANRRFVKVKRPARKK